MKHTTAFGLLVAGVLAAFACTELPTSDSDTQLRAKAAGAQRVGVMTQNLYVGTDVDAVLAALMSPDPNDDVPALFTAVETLGKTDFTTRAGAIADEIARERPHVVGFQEVSEIFIDLSAFGGPTVNLPFLPILEAQLAARGLHYATAATVKNIDVSLLGGAIRLVDYDAMLVDTDLVTVDYAYGFNFA